KPYTPEFNAIEAIYDQLNQKKAAVDITAVMRRLQQEVNLSVTTLEKAGDTDCPHPDDDYVDLSTLDFDKLRAAFAKSTEKNTVVFDLQQAIAQRLAQMMQQNPTRLVFYEKYQAIIQAYNDGKDLQAVQKAFDELNVFLKKELTPETERAMREELDEETLAIFDLLKKPTLSLEERKKVKEVAKETLDILKAEKLKIERWRESTQVAAQVRVIIDERLQWLPADSYPDDELEIRGFQVYQHVYSHYQGGGVSAYGRF
ncbi:MAG: hypothetical protein RL122_2498, partial [Pseudomonadota bacterium]